MCHIVQSKLKLFFTCNKRFSHLLKADNVVKRISFNERSLTIYRYLTQLISKIEYWKTEAILQQKDNSYHLYQCLNFKSMLVLVPSFAIARNKLLLKAFPQRQQCLKDLLGTRFRMVVLALKKIQAVNICNQSCF